ncbi:hypothetical protein AWB80_04679 [Caballeronia pedi]|uniref:Glycine zipper domain-containing protein n=1 Tax=Caballeronia pedi TaxID=1777141 RepID=A0A158C8M6_9BURK|nr:glycine zipper domain-containing protein [Caballeronia pedi]SAK77867.1 hypothetical protein AWB80_04679 [Caballeronia pedi]
MNAYTLRAGCALVIAVMALDAIAQSKPIAYPSKGQSAQQQQNDDGACYSWAKSNTGIDPATASAAPPPQGGAAAGGGQRVGGAARGAAGGAAIGAIAGDAGKGAAVGAVAGTMAGGARARQEKRAQQSNAQAQSQGAMTTYYRAWAACMQGRGYSIQ